MVYWPSKTLRDSGVKKKEKKRQTAAKRSDKYKRARQRTIETQNIMLLSNHHGYKHYDILY